MHPSPTRNSWRRLGQWIVLTLGLLVWLFVLGFAVGMSAMCASEILQGRASLGWQTAPGRIGYAQLRERSGKGGKTYTPVIGYRYRAGGRTWTSYRIEATSGYSPAQARKMMERFPPGAAVVVYHDGQGQSVLIQGVRATSWFGLCIWLLCFWFVVATTWYEAARFSARRRGAGA